LNGAQKVAALILACIVIVFVAASIGVGYWFFYPSFSSANAQNLSGTVTTTVSTSGTTTIVTTTRQTTTLGDGSVIIQGAITTLQNGTAGIYTYDPAAAERYGGSNCVYATQFQGIDKDWCGWGFDSGGPVGPVKGPITDIASYCAAYRVYFGVSYCPVAETSGEAMDLASLTPLELVHEAGSGHVLVNLDYLSQGTVPYYTNFYVILILAAAAILLAYESVKKRMKP